MPVDPTQLVVRRPRHEAAQNDSCRIWLEFLNPELRLVREVQLVDVSRHGAQVRLTSPIEPGETLFVRIQSDEARLDITLQGTVCWQRIFGPGHWAVGCLFTEELSYEVMGELFLCGILDMGPAAG